MLSLEHRLLLHRCFLAIAALVLMTACQSVPDNSPPENPQPAWIELSDSVRLGVVQTGWVAVKQRFRQWQGPAALRLPAIVLNRDWTEWMPIQFYVVDHPEGVFILDTGETADAMNADHFACDPLSRWFYTRQLQFAIKPEHELGPQLKLLGLDTSDVDTVVLSHLHSDHIGGLKHVSQARWMVSQRDANGHAGALLCRIPQHANTEYVVPDDHEFGAFERSTMLTAANDLAIVPTPGHTRGHQSLLLKICNRYVLLAGDVVFDEQRLQQGHALAGIVEDVDGARQSIEVLNRQRTQFDTLIVPAHDVEALNRARQFSADC